MAEITQKDIYKLLATLDDYLPIYDSLEPKLQEEWDKVEAEAIGAEIDAILNKKQIADNLKNFLDVLGAKIKKEAN